MSRVGLLIPWCRLSDLSKCNIPVHMFYLFYESHYTMSRCLIQGVTFLGLWQLWLTFGYSRVALHWHQWCKLVLASGNVQSFSLPISISYTSSKALAQSLQNLTLHSIPSLSFSTLELQVQRQRWLNLPIKLKKVSSLINKNASSLW